MEKIALINNIELGYQYRPAEEALQDTGMI